MSRKIFSFHKTTEADLRKRPLANLHTWSFKDLKKRERGYGVHDMQAEELRAEIKRRREHRSQIYTLSSVTAAAISAFGSMIAAIVSLMSARGK
jgi:hypothetical protein